MCNRTECPDMIYTRKIRVNVNWTCAGTDSHSGNTCCIMYMQCAQFYSMGGIWNSSVNVADLRFVEPASYMPNKY